MKFTKRLHQSNRGQTLVEVLVAIGIAGILLPTLATALVASREGRAQEEERIQASALLRETEEAVRSIREKNWTEISVNGVYHPVISGSSWGLAAGSETMGNFTREITVSDVQRDASGGIVTSGGTVDPSTKHVLSSVSWTMPLASAVTSEVYLHRYIGNTTWSQTGQAEFDTGTLDSAVTTNTAGGEVQLTSGSIISWQNPNVIDGYNAPATTDGTDVYLDTETSRVYLAVSTSVYILDVSNPASPSLLGSYNAGTGATISKVYVSGDYAYLSTAHNTAELIVVNVTNPASPVLADNLNLGDATNATSVFVDGSYAYVGKELSTTNNVHEFYIVNIANPSNITLAGSFNLSGSVNSLHISGDNAYLATALTTAELTVLNVVNKAAPSQAGTYDAPGSAAANDVQVVGNTVYLATNANAAGAEYYLIDTTTPSAPSQLSSYETGLNIFSTHVVGSRAFLAMARSNEQLTVLDISNPLTPQFIGNANLQNNDANDVMFSENHAYVASSKNNSELMILTGSPSSSGYATSGSLQSSTFDAGTSVAFNYVDLSFTQPIGTTLQLQVAANDDNSTWNYVGPDGTSGSYFTSPDAAPFTLAGRYFRYRVELGGDGTQTPVFENMTVNYSP